MMADSIESHPETKKDLFQLAIPVAEQVEILDVLLVQCDATRSSKFVFKGDELTLTTGVAKLAFGRNEESKRLSIYLTFGVRLARDADEGPDVLVNVAAKFVLVYSVKSFEGIDEDHVHAFSLTNGVFNAWPYWREFVQTTTGRMGLPRPVIVPVFRLGENPFEDFASEVDSSGTLGQAD